MLLFLPLLFGAVAAAQDAPADSPSSYAGRTIVRIDFDPPEQPIPRAELERLLPFHVGSALNPSAVRAALQKLYETGRFSNIAIDAQPSPDGAGAALKIITERSAKWKTPVPTPEPEPAAVAVGVAEEDPF